ncbi:DUF4097 domain-containing protein [Fructilactobacillus myrtifloralis]|uniref:DUF4097 domain-containing protein n=1 Tax=Fructilactobacillus myrtifloralis TaxID=2940301 RepID=A0ABY5BPP7_9LACO|nr:DUF4097 family beta strand repeat-containing protein [Fructilactobacillus myrtifloralis]USS85680.1 DUF4097 domain-containing protein [Fructilactobacillus myrtifloralis]
MYKKTLGLAILGLALAAVPAVLTTPSSLAASSQTQKVKNTAQLDTLEVNVPAQVTVKSGTEFTVQSNFAGQQKPEVSKNGDHIEVTFKDQKRWDAIKNNHKSKDKVVITLPKIAKPKTVKINSGALNFKTPTAIQNFQATSNGSNLTLNQAHFKATKLESANGDVRSNDSELGKTTVKSASGDVHFKNTKTQAIQVESGSGDVAFEKVDADRPVKINSSAGDIALNQTNLTKVTLNSGSGEIETHDLIAKDLTLNSGSGDVTMTSQKPVAYDRLKLNSESGDVQIKNAKINHSSINTDGGDLNLQHVSIKHKEDQNN